MSKLEGIIEEILYDAVDSYVSENLEEIIVSICGKVTNEIPADSTEEKMTLSRALEEVVIDWLENGDGYVYIRDDMENQADNSCDYEYDCERIIFDYGFTRSLETAKEYGVRLSDTDESEVAHAVLLANLPSRKAIREEVENHVRCSNEFQKLVDEEQEKKKMEQKGGDA